MAFRTVAELLLLTSIAFGTWQSRAPDAATATGSSTGRRSCLKRARVEQLP